MTMKTEQITQILDKIKNVSVAVYGDFCLDAYWVLDSNGGEISVETRLQAQAVSKHYYTLGGASNVVANLAALNPAIIKAIGVIGNDVFGRELLRQLQSLNVDTDDMIIQKEDFDTVTFAKRYLQGAEQPRIDFGFFNKRSVQTDEALLKSIELALVNFDVLIFNQQVPGSINNEAFIDEVNKLFEKYDHKIVLLDSRHYGDKFKNVWRKTNDIEASRLTDTEADFDDVIPFESSKQNALKLYEECQKPVFLTRGARGMIVADSEGMHEIDGIQILGKIDTVGAGDTTISALGLSLAAGFKPFEAAQFANYAAVVTVQKLFQTGTATGQEIFDVCRNANYIYQPELAEDIRQAEYWEDSEIELCYPGERIPFGRLTQAVFDHDGTISALREGWEQIMEPVMIKAILGDHYDTADETLYHKVRKRVIDYIDQSTGIQTIIQMEALVGIVKEFGIIPPGKVLDKFGYKKIYNDALMEMVNQRIKKISTGQYNANDYIIKGAIEFLKALKREGVKLYLASGTDHEDVVNEAEVLGYADLFDGGIYGAIGDVSKYSKKIVIDKIIKENKLHGSELAVFGDGPVEIQECRRYEGIAVGIASDEIRRYGLKREKRSRLIKAGAQIVIPDFSQFDKLTRLLFEK